MIDVLRYIEKMKEMYEGERITAQGPRNMYAGGQLVQNTADGSRPGYSGVYKRQEKPGHAVKWRIRGKRGGVDSVSWLKERGYETTFTSKAEAEKVNKLFNEAITKTKGEITTANWMKEGKELAEEFNAKVLKDFENKNMSNTASWKKFLEGKKLKHAGVDHYKSKRVVVGAMDSHIKKYELADILIDDATKNLKYTDWMDIQKKLTKGPNINFKSFRKHIDKHNKLNSPSVKANQAFDYLLNNNISMEIPKKLPLSLQGERGNLLRKVIHDLTGVGVKPIIEGLNANKNYKNYKKLIEFTDHSGLWKESAGKTLKEIMDVADYRVGGSVSWSYGTTKKIAKDANGSIFEFAKRHWNYHMKNQTGDTKVKFYWKNKFDKNGKPLEIDWETVPKNKSSVKSIKPTKVFFRYKNPETGLWGKKNWSMISLRADGLKSGLFTEVYDAKKAYDTLLSTSVTNPFNPEGNKIRFGQLMKKAFKEGFDDLSISPYAMEHGSKGLYKGVHELPFNNIKIATTRVNGALNALDNMSKAGTINKNVTKIILNELSQNVFDPYSKTFVNDIKTAGQELATGVAKGTIYEPKKTELNILGENVIQKSKDFTKLPSKTQKGLLHVAGIDLSKPEGKLQLNKLIKTAKTAKGPGKLKALGALLTLGGAGFVASLGFSPTEVKAAEAQAAETGVVDKAKSWPVEHPWLTGGAATGAAAATKVGRKAIGTVLNLGFGPTGAAALTYGLRPEGGYDLSKTGDRIGFEAEAAFANPLVKGAVSVTDKIKNPMLRKIAERAALAGMSPAFALKASRVATPIGIGSLILEGSIKSAKDTMAAAKQIDAIQDQDLQRQEYDNLIRNIVGYAGGGMVGIRKPHAVPPERQGLRSIMINGKKS